MRISPASKRRPLRQATMSAILFGTRTPPTSNGGRCASRATITLLRSTGNEDSVRDPAPVEAWVVPHSTRAYCIAYPLLADSNLHYPPTHQIQSGVDLEHARSDVDHRRHEEEDSVTNE